jgi:hypothetical protein
MDVTPPLIERIRIALNEIRTARDDGDWSRELGWSNMLDRLLDAHIKLLQMSGCFRPLEVVDAALAARLTVR